MAYYYVKVSGIALIVNGSMSLTKYTELATFTGSGLSRTSMLLIAQGIIVVGITVSYHCCGAENYTDWFRSKGWGNRSSVPASCCLVEYDFCGHVISKTTGCVQTIRQCPGKNLERVAAASIGLGVVEVFGALLGMCLFQDLKRRSYEKMYLKMILS
ncbi:CD63 antigen-like [Oncorhynchus clarkii lewisi]|uniref:CD63 antigen-like n=1 Tax=Oncorhynchus clarkii lewisi TaxID=490388 RepID=UPI0039B9972D